MKIKIELETTESETFSALEKLEYFADRIREAAALFQGKIIEEMAADFPWPPEERTDWPESEEEEEEEEEAHFDEGHPWPDEDFEFVPSREEPPIQFKKPIDTAAVAEANTAPIWSTVALSAASSPHEEEEREAATPYYLKPDVKSAASISDLPTLSPEIRSKAWASFEYLVGVWAENFNQAGPQPDRLEALRQVGSGPYALAVLVMAFEVRSLQRLVEKALIRQNIGNELDRLELADQIAGNMVQVSHLVYPDLAGTYDYSTKWRRA